MLGKRGSKELNDKINDDNTTRIVIMPNRSCPKAVSAEFEIPMYSITVMLDQPLLEVIPSTLSFSRCFVPPITAGNEPSGVLHIRPKYSFAQLVSVSFSVASDR